MARRLRNLRSRVFRKRLVRFLYFTVYYVPWHFLYFFPLPQGQGSLRPTFSCSRTIVLTGPGASPPSPPALACCCCSVPPPTACKFSATPYPPASSCVAEVTLYALFACGVCPTT